MAGAVAAAAAIAMTHGGPRDLDREDTASRDASVPRHRCSVVGIVGAMGGCLFVLFKLGANGSTLSDFRASQWCRFPNSNL